MHTDCWQCNKKSYLFKMIISASSIVHIVHMAGAKSGAHSRLALINTGNKLNKMHNTTVENSRRFSARAKVQSIRHYIIITFLLQYTVTQLHNYNYM